MAHVSNSHHPTFKWKYEHAVQFDKRWIEDAEPVEIFPLFSQSAFWGRFLSRSEAVTVRVAERRIVKNLKLCLYELELCCAALDANFIEIVT